MAHTPVHPYTSQKNNYWVETSVCPKKEYDKKGEHIGSPLQRNNNHKPVGADRRVCPKKITMTYRVA